MTHRLRTVVLVAVLCLLVPAAWADVIPYPVIDQYNVNGLLTITGNNVCPPFQACAETLGFSLVVDIVDSSSVQAILFPFAAYVVPGLGTLESLGPLGQFNLLGGGGVGGFLHSPTPALGGDSNYVAFFDTGGDEIDIHFARGDGLSRFVPSIVSADVYGCQTVTCANDFSRVGPQPSIGVFNYGEVEATVTLVPEPQTLALLLIGLAGIIALQGWRRSPYASAWLHTSVATRVR